MASTGKVISVSGFMARNQEDTTQPRPNLREARKTRKLGKKGRSIRAYAILAGFGIAALVILFSVVTLIANLATWFSAGNGGSTVAPGDGAPSSAYYKYNGGEEEVLHPTAAEIAEYNRNYQIEQMAGLMVANYIRIGTPIDSYQHGNSDEDLAFYNEALALAQENIDALPDRVILPETVYIEIPGQNRVPLKPQQMENLNEVYGYFTRGFGVMPNYLDGLPPHLAAAIAGRVGQADGFRNDTSRKNGYFGSFQLGSELYEAYVAWCTSGGNTEVYTDVWHQCAFFWDVMNGWGYGTYVSLDYSDTLADFLESETVAEAVVILNSGKDGDSTDGIDGFFRSSAENQTAWAEQIYAQLLEVRP